MTASRIDRDELRQLIREALKEALGQPSPPGGEWVLPVKDRPGGGSQANRQRGEDSSPTPPHKREEKGAARLDSGVLGEAKVVELGRAHNRILVGPDTVITPLARDKARELKVEIVRQKP